MMHQLSPGKPPCSQSLEVKVWRGGKEHEQHYASGEAQSELMVRDLPSEERNKRGTQVRGRDCSDNKQLGWGVASGAAKS